MMIKEIKFTIQVPDDAQSSGNTPYLEDDKFITYCKANKINVQKDETLRDAAAKVFKHPYSRYPVYDSSIHEVMGIVMSFDIMEALAEGKDNELITSVVREGLVVDSSIRCDQLIMLFKDKHIHLAIVQEDNHTIGLVTLEDVLEELVGDIEDETDVE